MPTVEPLTSGTQEPKPSKNRLLVFIGVTAAAVAGVAAVIKDVDSVRDPLHRACQATGKCASDPLPTPVLANYDSPKMGGGHNQAEQCNPLRDKYAAENPKFNIVVHSSEDSDKDWKGHVTYKYHCRYSATPK